jgi:7-cyano-7-deazaguanine synthase in queuosine biosynthesis
MCGIAFFWAKEGTLEREEIRRLFEGAAKRGGDGFGYSILSPTKKQTTLDEKVMDSKVWDTHISDIERNLKVGDMLFIAFRATPETELESSPQMLQPLIHLDPPFVLIHNGGVTETEINNLKGITLPFSWETKIDSEAILANYMNYNGNMKDCMEDLSGSFSFVLLDVEKGKLFSVSSFLPLAHMYIKGVGYYLHSSLETLEQIQFERTGFTKGEKAVWHHWYAHYLEGYQIIETDIESGLQKSCNYRPKFLHTRCPDKSKGKKGVFIAASGGIDSGVTTLALKHFLPSEEYNVKMIHFDYGQRSAKAERWAVINIAETLDVALEIVDISLLYSKFIRDLGMLMNENAMIESGGDKLKSTIAWVAGRNALFASLLLAKAESRLLYRADTEIYLAGGWAQLSEETGGYPDNSFKFVESLKELKKYGYIAGADIHFINVLQNLTKTETWKLGHYLKFPFQFSCSCDNPKVNPDDTITLCLGCGSTKLSCIAADRADVHDPRRFDFNGGKDGRGAYWRPRFADPTKVSDIHDIINRLVLPKEVVR